MVTDVLGSPLYRLSNGWMRNVRDQFVVENWRGGGIVRRGRDVALAELLSDEQLTTIRQARLRKAHLPPGTALGELPARAPAKELGPSGAIDACLLVACQKPQELATELWLAFSLSATG